MKLWKTGVLLLTMMALASVVIGCGAGSTTVKIGLLSPQTGPIAQYAPGFEDAADIAIAELNAAYDGEYVFEFAR